MIHNKEKGGKTIYLYQTPDKTFAGGFLFYPAQKAKNWKMLI